MNIAASKVVTALLLCACAVAIAAAPADDSTGADPFRSVVLLQGDALFDFDQASPTGRGMSRLAELTARLDALEQLLSIHVIGHADSTGAQAYNYDLSLRRARSVALYFSTQFPRTRVSFAASGENHPVTDNTTADGRRVNRRVEIEIVAIGDQRSWLASQ